MRMDFRPAAGEVLNQITKQSGCSFLFLFQRTVLLGLKEAGRLNEMQHRQAEAILLEQYRANIREHAEPLKDD